MDPIINSNPVSPASFGPLPANVAPSLMGSAAPRPSFQADRFTSSQPAAAAPQPAKISGLDKFLMPLFNNVYPAPDNIAAYKAVQELRKANKDQYIYPGTPNSAAVL